MSSATARRHHDHELDAPAGRYVLADGEVDELERACAAADEDEHVDRLVPLADVVAALRGA
jgi:hypothetical protein